MAARSPGPAPPTAPAHSRSTTPPARASPSSGARKRRSGGMTACVIVFGAFRLEGLSGYWGAVWLLLFAGGVVFLFWTYRGIYQRSGRGLTWWLLALRGAGVCLLVLMLVKPVLTRERDEVEPGRVAIVVDTS